MSIDDDSSRARLHRPEDGTPSRWPWIAFWFVIASLAVGGWYAFGPAAPLADEPAGTSSLELPSERSRILHASWGAVDDAPPTSESPEPAEPTEWQQRERAFHEMGRSRWKGTEIFVRRQTR